jgi:hypothetical protein
MVASPGHSWSGGKKKGFDRLFALVTWEIWKERNAPIFRRVSTQASQVVALIKQQGELWIDAGAKKLGCLLVSE